ncbi:hypothetical protein WJX84_002083 [Apatococcus fuscideae]|uniref:Serine-threonine/tyrosine-protein kinase catalytic domain-containing protein n=1 Tax=Apatococcus fuscideae TaxID=2026836 RepID=A0AAW1SDB7_9CHLO
MQGKVVFPAVRKADKSQKATVFQAAIPVDLSFPGRIQERWEDWQLNQDGSLQTAGASSLIVNKSGIYAIRDPAASVLALVDPVTGFIRSLPVYSFAKTAGFSGAACHSACNRNHDGLPDRQSHPAQTDVLGLQRPLSSPLVDEGQGNLAFPILSSPACLGWNTAGGVGASIVWASITNAISISGWLAMQPLSDGMQAPVQLLLLGKLEHLGAVHSPDFNERGLAMCEAGPGPESCTFVAEGLSALHTYHVATRFVDSQAAKRDVPVVKWTGYIGNFTPGNQKSSLLSGKSNTGALAGSLSAAGIVVLVLAVVYILYRTTRHITSASDCAQDPGGEREQTVQLPVRSEPRPPRQRRTSTGYSQISLPPPTLTEEHSGAESLGQRRINIADVDLSASNIQNSSQAENRLSGARASSAMSASQARSVRPVLAAAPSEQELRFRSGASIPEALQDTWRLDLRSGLVQLNLNDDGTVVELRRSTAGKVYLGLLGGVRDVAVKDALQSDAARRLSWYDRGQDVARDIAAAVYCVQSKGIVGHLDASNVLLDEHDRPRIAAADLLDPLDIPDPAQPNSHDHGQLCGLAPEVLQGEPLSFSTAVYSFGVMLWKLITGNSSAASHLRPVRVPADQLGSKIVQVQSRTVQAAAVYNQEPAADYTTAHAPGTTDEARLARKPFDALRKLNFSGPPDVGTETWLRQLKRDPVKDFEWIRQTGLSLARSLLADKECFAALKADNYDLILRDTIGWQTQLLSKMLEVPEVDILTAGVALPLLGPRYSIPNRIAYIPQMGSLLPSVMTFKQRLQNYAWYLLFRYAIMAGKSTEERQLAESYGYDLDSSWLPRSTAPALIAGGDWALEYPMPLPPKVQVVLPG